MSLFALFFFFLLLVQNLQHPSLLHFTSAVVNSMKQTHLSTIPVLLSLCFAFSPLLTRTPYPSFTHLPHLVTCFPVPSPSHLEALYSSSLAAQHFRPRGKLPGPNLHQEPNVAVACGREWPGRHLVCSPLLCSCSCSSIYKTWSKNLGLRRKENIPLYCLWNICFWYPSSCVWLFLKAFSGCTGVHWEHGAFSNAAVLTSSTESTAGIPFCWAHPDHSQQHVCIHRCSHAHIN